MILEGSNFYEKSYSSFFNHYSLELIKYSEDADGADMYATWRADYTYIDFSLLHAI